MPPRLTFLFLLIAGCSGASPAADPDAGADSGLPDEIAFFFDPLDRTSAVAPDAPMRLVWGVESAGDPRIAATLPHLRLTSQTTGEDVDIETSEPTVGLGSLVETAVRPRSPLGDDFYRLWVDELPDGVVSLQTPSPDGTHGVRFHVGTYPVLARITVCPSTSADSSVNVTFSEPMAEGTAAQIEIEGARCGAGELSESTVRFTCDPIARDATLTVRVDPTIRAASGADLVHPEENAGTHTLALDELEWGFGCGDYWGYWPTPY